MKTLIILIKKEFIQLKRNPFLLRMIFGFPVMVILIIPLVTTMDIQSLGVTVIDHDNSLLSNRIIRNISESKFFEIYQTDNSHGGILKYFNNRKTDVIVTIPNHYEKKLHLKQETKINVEANAVNAVKGTVGIQYVLKIIAQSIQQKQEEIAPVNKKEITVVQNWYNPTLNYRYFMIPALIIMLLLMICGYIPTLNIMIEKEKGTIEQINVSPIKPTIFILSKLIPFWIIGIIVLSISIILAWLVYGLIPEGTIFNIYLASILFILAISGFGIAVANKSKNMQQAVFVMFFFIMISMLLSGLLTPIASMPKGMQEVTYFLPPRYYIDIMRSVYLKGSSFLDLKLDYSALFISSILLNILAIMTYRKQR